VPRLGRAPQSTSEIEPVAMLRDASQRARIERLERDEWRCAAPQHEGAWVQAPSVSINLVLRSAHLILGRACPAWGARLEGLRASRRTATSEIEPVAMLRDASQRARIERLERDEWRCAAPQHEGAWV
jgi:hypothetical protein